MDDLLTKQNISVETEFDRVILNVEKLSFLIPYAEGFKIAAGITSAGKEALRLCREPRKDWRKWLELDENLHVNEVSALKRSTPQIRKFKWHLDVNGEMLYLWMGNNRVGFHFETGFKIAQWLRLGSKQAKHWAGDTGRVMHLTGRLTDAEDNYKRNLH